MVSVTNLFVCLYFESESTASYGTPSEINQTETCELTLGGSINCIQ